VIADKLSDLSRTFQIICITHMPEIAARGGYHLVVSKASAKGRTRVDVKPVDGDDRTAEIARMLGGEQGSDHRLALAGELLAATHKGANKRAPGSRRRGQDG
jgi:DNA repair protein RecN (Recombination protein N)